MASWLTSLQDRAETFLEQVDQVAADKLSGGKTPGKNGRGAEGIAAAAGGGGGGGSGSGGGGGEDGFVRALSLDDSTLTASTSTSTLTTTATATTTTTAATPSSSSTTAGTTLATTAQAPSSSSLLLDSTTNNTTNNRPTNNINTSNTNTTSNTNDSTQLARENKMLKTEMAALEDEIASFSSRIRGSQEQLKETKESLVSARQQLTEATTARTKLNVENARLRESLSTKEKEFGVLQGTVLALQEQARLSTQQRDAVLNEQARATETHTHALATLRSELDTLRNTNATGAAAGEGHVRELETTLSERDAEIKQLRASLDNAKGAASTASVSAASLKSELDALHKEHTEYKTRATRILQSKEKVISELRGEGSSESGGGTTAAGESEAIRRQCDSLRVELEEAQTQIAELTSKLQDQSQQHVSETEWAETRIAELEQQLRDEKSARVDAESQRETTARDSVALQDELRRTQQSMQAALSARQLEMDALQTQLAKRPGAAGTIELEQRLQALTDALYQKQGQLESVSAEKNSLALQLETERRRQREEARITIVRPDPPADLWDEARMRVNSPFANVSGDTPIVRKVKAAANVLDAFSIRLGVFLRRFPVARIFVLLYMGLLHCWVMIVLLTYTPEAHMGLDTHLPQPKP